MQYAQIRAGKVNIIEVADATALAALRATGLTIIDISGRDPKPLTGWDYDATTDEFSAPGVDAEAYVYLHMSIDGGDGGDPPGIANDGAESVTITCTFRVGEDTESDVLAINMTRRVNIRDSSGAIADIVKVTFVDGACSFNYTFPGNPGIYHIAEEDFTEKVGGATIKIVGDSTVKVYRDFSI